MLEVQYFARYREELGLSHEQIQWQPDFANLGALRDYLLTRGAAWQVLQEHGLMCARNQEMCSLEEPLLAGDSVAFFPTVTGG